MNSRTVLNTVRKLVTGVLIAFLVWMAIVNSPLVPRATHAAEEPGHGDKKHDHKQDGKDDKHDDAKAAHHEPNVRLHHVMDSEDWELFMSFGRHSFHIPIFHYELFGKKFGFPTKFMILEAVAALLVIAVFVPLAKKIQAGGIPRGSWANFFEVFLTFIRDQIAKPSLGEHDADKYTPFLWTLFLFILFNNLLGMVPFGGSATASIYVTLALALIVFFAIHGSAIMKMGFGHYISSMWPHIDVPFPMGLIIKPMIFFLEWMGVLVRNLVLAVRLFANMFAGHMVMATILIFIYMAKDVGPLLWSGITISSVLGIIALSLLELFVALLQAYIFTFLTALFLGMAMHPEH